MASRPQPGLAFFIVCDVGFAIGLMTHDVPKIGSLIWIAEPTFDEQPNLEAVSEIGAWRWPVFFPLASALRRKLVTRIGPIAVPPPLREFPVLRSGNRQMGWVAFTEVGGVRQRLGPTDDASLPIYQVVNDTALKEMIVTGWRPEDDW